MAVNVCYREVFMSDTKEILKLIDVLSGLKKDNFEKKYPNKRRKVRFNVSWQEEFSNADGKKKIKVFDFLEKYKSDNGAYLTNNTKSEFLQWILSLGSGQRKRLRTDEIVFQFIKIDLKKWLFVGAYEVLDLNGVGVFNLSETQSRQFLYANVRRLAEYDVYVGRLVVDFTNMPQQFYYVQDDIIDSIEVSEILPCPYLEKEEEFKGYDNVCKSYWALQHCMKQSAWRDALKSVYGVYLLTDTKTGKQYVGSATGTDGIYGRWSTYLKNGYEINEKEYPNKRLKELVKKETIKYIKENFQYTILEIFSKNDYGRDKALKRESYWKDVLKTREFGYNDN